MTASAPLPAPAPNKVRNRFLPGYRARLARDGLSSFKAEFIKTETEAKFQKHLVKFELPEERMINFAGVILYFAYGLIDILTIKENLSPLLFMRWGVIGPLSIVLVSLTFFDRFKPYFGAITASVMFIFANLIVAMIVMMQATNAPPYLIGIFFVFIFCSCVQRMPFRLAAAVFLLTAINYVTSVLMDADMIPADRVSGIAFMVSFTVIAAITIYVQEIEARLIWQRDTQKQQDAVHIEELLIEATAADQSKNNFISVLSHELRTPLHQIIGFSEVIKAQSENNGSGQTAEFLDQIHGSAHQLLERIGKMLRYADATAGKIQYDYETCNMIDIIDTLTYEMQKPAAAASVTLDVSDVEDASLRLDAIHTQYALTHLMENAIDASAPGDTVKVEGEKEADGGYVLKVIDHGKGMSEDQMAAAFSPFTQGASPHTRSRGGIGLGLPLARKILSAQSALLSVDSTPGEGTIIAIAFSPKPEEMAA